MHCTYLIPSCEYVEVWSVIVILILCELTAPCEGQRNGRESSSMSEGRELLECQLANTNEDLSGQYRRTVLPVRFDFADHRSHKIAR
jgi:hypothetical protein